jgi:predicted transposase/invertase (TIGR01784 family)
MPTNHPTRQLITFDWAIKTILRNKANFGILEGFLSELFGFDIEILELLESESNQQTAVNKYTRTDLKAKDTNGKIYIIELQYNYQMDYLQRVLYNTSKAVVEQLDQGEKYEALHQVISVNILHFEFGQGTDYIYKGTTDFIGIHQHDQLRLNLEQKKTFQSEHIQDLFPIYYLLQVKRFNDVLQDKLDEWMYFLKEGEIKPEFNAKGLQQASEALDVLNMNDIDRTSYDTYLDSLRQAESAVNSAEKKGFYYGVEVGTEIGEKKGIEIGKEQGELKAKLETARKLHARGMSMAEIADITGLTTAQLAAINIHS